MKIVVLNQSVCIIGGLIALAVGIWLVFFPRRSLAFIIEMRRGYPIGYERALAFLDDEPIVRGFQMVFHGAIGLGFLFFAVIALTGAVFHYDLLNQARLVPLGNGRAMLMKP